MGHQAEPHWMTCLISSSDDVFLERTKRTETASRKMNLSYREFSNTVTALKVFALFVYIPFVSRQLMFGEWNDVAKVTLNKTNYCCNFGSSNTDVNTILLNNHFQTRSSQLTGKDLFLLGSWNFLAWASTSCSDLTKQAEQSYLSQGIHRVDRQTFAWPDRQPSGCALAHVKFKNKSILKAE